MHFTQHGVYYNIYVRNKSQPKILQSSKHNILSTCQCTQFAVTTCTRNVIECESIRLNHSFESGNCVLQYKMNIHVHVRVCNVKETSSQSVHFTISMLHPNAQNY